MNKFTISKTLVTALLTVLLIFHLFHLYSAWEKSRIEIVDAIYTMVPDVLNNLSGQVNFEQVLINRLKIDGQSIEDYRPSLYVSNRNINIAFALTYTETKQIQILKNLEDDLNRNIADALRQSSVSAPCLCMLTGKVGKVHLLSWKRRFNPWFKPLDILSLAMLVGALFLWTKDGNDTIDL